VEVVGELVPRGDLVGPTEGLRVGTSAGDFVTILVGDNVEVVGELVPKGDLVGSAEIGIIVGGVTGNFVGLFVGSLLGALVFTGEEERSLNGAFVGALVSLVGFEVGPSVSGSSLSGGAGVGFWLGSSLISTANTTSPRESNTSPRRTGALSPSLRKHKPERKQASSSKTKKSFISFKDCDGCEGCNSRTPGFHR
jgi:hypothetical protein